MANGIGNLPTTPTTDADRVVKALGPRPAQPAQRLTAFMPPLLREVDWGHIPTAPHAPVSMTRAEVSEQLDATDDGDWDRGPVVPKVPGQRSNPDTPTPKVPGPRPGAAREPLGFGFGEHAAMAAFGSVA